MKGFMHVVEILLVAVLLFVVFAQFAAIPSISDEWPGIKLQLMADDVLAALDAKGVDWFNATEIEQEFNTTLPANVIRSVTLENVIKPEIRVGCLCNDAGFARVRAMLSPGWFVVNGINATFETVQVTDPDKLFSLDFDAVLVHGYRDLSPFAGPFRNFLSYGRGAVEIADRPAIDSVQSGIFGLGQGAADSDGSEITFSRPSLESGVEANRIFGLFDHLPAFYDEFADLGQWTGSGNLAGTGNPAPSARLSGNGCSSMDSFLSTGDFGSFEDGEIDFDVYLPSGSSLLVAFGRGGGYDYLAMISSNATTGFDSFFRRSPLQAIGTNTSHLTAPLEWSHVKIAANATEMVLYNNGKRVAEAAPSDLAPSNVSLYSRCGDAYADNVRVTYKSMEFRNLLSGENTTQRNNDTSRMPIVQKGTGLPASVINYNIEGLGDGRTAWITDAPVTDEYRTLVKSLVVWAAGDEYRVVRADIRNPVSAYIYKPLGSDMLQNAKITLELSYLY